MEYKSNTAIAKREVRRRQLRTWSHIKYRKPVHSDPMVNVPTALVQCFHKLTCRELNTTFNNNIVKATVTVKTSTDKW
jgi:hypothetical protein